MSTGYLFFHTSCASSHPCCAKEETTLRVFDAVRSPSPCGVHLRSGDEDMTSLHPATIEADRLVSELEESRMLREKDRLRYEVKLQEAERDKGKLLRQVSHGFIDAHVVSGRTSQCTCVRRCLMVPQVVDLG